MIDFEKVHVYKQYLNTITPFLEERFENQKEYLCCQKGCSHCCEIGAYPYTQVEFEYLMLGFFKLSIEEQEKIVSRIVAIKEDYQKTENKKDFKYRCPFLSDKKVCSVYDFRGLICRYFGLLTMASDGKINMPFCSSLGLNYSKVYDENIRTINDDLVKEHGYKNPPKAYGVNLLTLQDKELFPNKELEFGEIKSLIEWIP